MPCSRITQTKVLEGEDILYRYLRHGRWECNVVLNHNGRPVQVHLNLVPPRSPDALLEVYAAEDLGGRGGGEVA